MTKGSIKEVKMVKTPPIKIAVTQRMIKRKMRMLVSHLPMLRSMMNMKRWRN